MVRAVLSASLLVLAACSDPAAPDKERPPEPQASARPAPPRQDDLRRAIDRPIDRAREAQTAIDASVAARREAVDAAEAGADAADAAAP